MNVKCDAMMSSKMRINTGFEKDKLIRSKSFTARLSITLHSSNSRASENLKLQTLESDSGLQTGMKSVP